MKEARPLVVSHFLLVQVSTLLTFAASTGIFWAFRLVRHAALITSMYSGYGVLHDISSYCRHEQHDE